MGPGTCLVAGPTGTAADCTDLVVGRSGLVRQVIWPARGGMNVSALPGGLTAAIRHQLVPAGIVSTAGLTDAA